ncbi:MAG: SH3 domain-containing protein [Caldilineaceae bacterium SB0668_bin_21]|nr:SH3 domain-containing protein [Caldilineaceae bacterium SB0668_bin_21]
MNRKVVIGVVVLILAVPGVLMAQGEYTLEDLAAQVEGLASDVVEILTSQDDLAQRVAAIETAIAPTVTLTLPPVPTPTRAKPFLTIKRRMNIRRGPGTEHDVLGVAEAGTEFGITGKNLNGDWWQIDYQGESAWVYASYVTASHAEEVRVASTPTRIPEPTFTPSPTNSPTSTASPTRRAIRLRTATPRPGRPPLSRATRTPRPSPTPVGTPGSRLKPVPRGYSYPMGDWQIAVHAYDADATSRVLSENIFNSPPPEGNRFVLVTLWAKYDGEGVGDISWTFAYSLNTGGIFFMRRARVELFQRARVLRRMFYPGG